MDYYNSTFRSYKCVVHSDVSIVTFHFIPENWVVLVNQMHSKVQGRLSAGLEAAKLKIERGEPVILQVKPAQ